MAGLNGRQPDQAVSRRAMLKALGLGRGLAAVGFANLLGVDIASAQVAVVDYLETTCIGAYLAAPRRFAELNMPLMSEVASQIGGSEAEHRVLNRVLGREVVGQPLLPNNIPWERPTLFHVSQAQQVLAPFLLGGEAFDRPFVGSLVLPPRDAVLAEGVPLDEVPPAFQAFRV